MQTINISEINSTLEHKSNKYLNIDGMNTGDIKVNFDIKPEDIKFNQCFIIAAVISKDYEVLDLMDNNKLSERNKEQKELLKKFLKDSKHGVMRFESIRKDLLQFEIVPNNNENKNYQVEIHLGNHNFCVCEDFEVVSIDAYK